MHIENKLTVIPCGVAIIRRGREFLIAQRRPEDTFGSFWEFPGGKKHLEETFEECVVRETKEELGVDVFIEKKFMEIKKDYNEKTIWLNFYLCSYISGEPRPLDCQNVQWADVAELKSFNFPPANEAVIDNLLKLYGG